MFSGHRHFYFCHHSTVFSYFVCNQLTATCYSTVLQFSVSNGESREAPFLLLPFRLESRRTENSLLWVPDNCLSVHSMLWSPWNWYCPCRPTMSMSLLTSAIHYVITAFMANHFNPIRGYNCSDNSDDSYGDSMYAMSHEQLCSAIELKAQRACVYIVVKPVEWPLYKSQLRSIQSYKATILHDISGLYSLSTMPLDYAKF